MNFDRSAVSLRHYMEKFQFNVLTKHVTSQTGIFLNKPGRSSVKSINVIPQTLEKLKGHIALGSSVRASVQTF